ncbi:polygalacturonase At1g48100 isoform X1 [Rhodamnia argentea]|uniref:Polygalacturonase At1g48100 isoform X1 n=2 Tax=Rhodamnia argentea TaxID=178133 RepID=A0A8B8QC94_9MYRT|nr:polygalacturonase At1g48100 isoform X1 [Rhodamnia argentea]
MRMAKINPKDDTILLLIAIFILSASLGTCYGREGKHWRHSEACQFKKGQGHRGGHRHHCQHHNRLSPKVNGDGYTVPQDTMTSLAGSSGRTTTFNVLDYGAKGDGHADDTKAFEAAWAAACQVAASTLVVPSGSVFMVKPISFSGPNCKPGIVFQLDGKIIAPTSSQAWGSGLLQWIEFTKLTKIKIKGKGTIDGQGSVWWNDSATVYPTDELDSVSSTAQNSTISSTDMISTNLSKMPSTKPTALRFYGSSDVAVNGITIQNSPQTHLKFDSCTDVQVFGVTISSPGDSPNTDGIHLQNSQNVLIYSTDIACGDDCVSIQTGCSNVYIHNVNCGPGHGISIGGLGKDNTKACVSNVTIRDTIITGTLTGVRIKTWQGGSGSVQDIMFSNIQVSEVHTPIMIDQFYCDQEKCKNETAAVAISGINYMNIKGTYTVQPVHFACSDSLPCIGVSLTSIELKSVQGSHLYDPFCWETYGELKTTSEPPISCLQKGKPSNLPSQLVPC